MEGNNKKYKTETGFLGGVFVVLAGLLWVTFTQYVGYQTEHSVRQAMQAFKLPSRQIYTELVDYQRHFMNAEYRFRFRSKNTNLDSFIKEWVIRSNVQHGPLIFNKDNVQLALSRMNFDLDLSQSSEDMQALAKRLFQNAEKGRPLRANLLIDYAQDAHYRVTLSPLNYHVADLWLNISGVQAAGTIAAEQTGVLGATVDKKIQVKFDEIMLRQKNLVVRALQNSLQIGLPGQQSFAQITLDTASLHTTTAEFTALQIEHLPQVMANFLVLFENYEALYWLDKQIGWTLELSGQNQEGQDHLAALYQQREDTKLPKVNQAISQLLTVQPEVVSYNRKIEPAKSSLAYTDSHL